MSPSARHDTQLELQYNNRAAVPEHGRIFAEWQTASARFRERADCQLHVSYGSGPRECFDFFPGADTGAPLQVFIHGGYWQAMDKRYFSFLAAPLVMRGISVAIINYPLCPSVTLDALVATVRSGVAWIWQHAHDFGVDPRRVQLCGHSAGGHLVGMLMAAALEGDDLPPTAINSGVAVSGLFQLEPLLATSVNDALNLDVAAARRNSPQYMNPSVQAPLLLGLGDAESHEYHRQSFEFAESWGRRGVPVEIHRAAGRNHFTVLQDLADPESRLFASVTERL